MSRKSRTLLLSCLVVLVGFGAAGCTGDTAAGSDADSPASFEVQGNEAVMTGVIGESTPDAVSDLIDDHPEVTTIVLTDVPGSDNDEANLEASSLVRQAQLATHVPADGLIASGGVDFFLAGAERSFDDGAEFGVHSWATGDGVNGDELSRDDPQHDPYLNYYDSIGVDQEFYWFTLQAAPPESFHIMTAGELDEYNFASSR